jgi:hypothetical protein
MRKTSLALILLAASTIALAAPTLIADPYAVGPDQPTSAATTVNGALGGVCTILTPTTAPTPSCDLAPVLTTVGNYVITMTAANATGVSTPSSPFTLTWRGSALAAPTMTLATVNNVQALRSQVYPTTANQPSAMTTSVDAGAAISCTKAAVTGGDQWTCPLTTVTAPGSHSAVTSATLAYKCVTAANAGTCNAAGSASSVPFSFVLSSPAATPTGLRVQ